jgi:hypothetical protein
MNETCKLDIQIDVNPLYGLNLPLYKTIAKHQKHSNEQAKSHDRLPIDILAIPSRRTRDYILDQIPNGVLQVEVPELSILEVTVPLNSKSPVIGAHVDLGRIAVFNYYMETNGEITSFPEDSFIAEDGDMYLMDVTKVHTVSLVPGTRRRILSMSFYRADFETLRRICASKICK